MTDLVRQKLLQKHILTAQEMAEVEKLTALCKEREGLLMPLDYNMLRLPTLPTDDLFLYYVDTQLVGYLFLDRYHSEVKETTGMVHPDFRSQGIFTQLFSAAREECRSRGVRQLLFICETTSSAGRSWVHSIGAGREFAEHLMVLGQFRPRFQYDPHLLVRKALPDDLDMLAFTLAGDFDDSKEKAREHLMRTWERPNQHFYLATYKTEPVGSLRIEEIPDRRAIYGFFIREEYRGRGYGRQLIEIVISELLQEKRQSVALDVDTNNLTALNLYLSCGFEIERTYEYYGLTLNL